MDGASRSDILKGRCGIEFDAVRGLKWSLKIMQFLPKQLKQFTV